MSASSGIGDDALAQRGHVAADRRQRRAQLVRDRHQEVALELLGLGELAGHVLEALRQVSDLAAPAQLTHVDVVVARGDLVGGGREREHRPRDAPGEPHREAADDDDAAEEGEREPRGEGHPLVTDVGVRRRDDERPERGRVRPAGPERVRRREKRTVLAGRRELEVADLAGADVDADVADAEARQAGVLAGKGSRPDVEEPVAARGLELRRGEDRRPSALGGLARRLGIELREAPCLSPQLGDGLVVRVALEQPDGDQGRDEPGERDRRQEQRRQAKAEGLHGPS